MASTKELLLMASRIMVDAEIAVQEAHVARHTAKAQYEAVRRTFSDAAYVMSQDEHIELLVRIADVDTALARLGDFTNNT